MAAVLLQPPFSIAKPALCSSSISIEEEEAQQNLVVKVASAAFSFSITINLRLQDITDIIKHITASEWIEWESMRMMVLRLNEVAAAWLANRKRLNKGSNIGSPFEVRRSSESSHNVEGDQATPDD
ncbi:hypothetical protein QL285_088748 [Trifolium repens]|nr:hypothetical protein QL285_088748 [Trifolium repens]